MLASEKRSLIRFLFIYLSSTFILFAIASYIFYNSSKSNIIKHQKETINFEANEIINKLRALHQSDNPKLPYPLIKGLDSAIYDLDKNYIFGTLPKSEKLKNLNDDKNIYLIKEIKPYYLGAAYLLIKKPINFSAINKLKRDIIIFLLIGAVIFSILGYYLGRLFIAPMRESIEKINRFIQDATHELNTPISTILNNIELIKALNLCSDAKDELNRISIASKTLSRIYEDLSYLSLNHKYYSKIEKIELKELIKQRVNYFKAMIEAKRLNLILDLEEVYLDIDKNDIIRVIDNLISNAIKYNKSGGKLKIILKRDFLEIIDSGIGISKSDLKKILERFKRANESEGGFGIGLDIVNSIVKKYNFKLEIKSQVHIGTKVKILWKN